MILKLPRFAQLWQRVKDTWNAKPAKLIEIQPNEIAIVFTSNDDYSKLLHAISDAETYTGKNYRKLIKKAQVIYN